LFKGLLNSILLIIVFAYPVIASTQDITATRKNKIDEVLSRISKNNTDSAAFKYGISFLDSIKSSNKTTDFIYSSIKLSQLFKDKRKFEKARYFLMELLDYTTKTNNEDAIFQAKYHLARIERKLLNFESAVGFATNILGRTDSLNLYNEKANLLFLISEVYFFKRMYDLSNDYNLQANELYLIVKDSIGLFFTENHFGLLHAYQGRPEIAIENFQKAKKMAKKIKYETGIASTLGNIAWMNFELEQYDMYLPFMMKCIQIHKKSNNTEKLSIAYDNLGFFYYHQGNYDKALKYYYKSI